MTIILNDVCEQKAQCTAYCSRCVLPERTMDQRPYSTLLDAPAGRKLLVKRLNGNREIRSRLYSMGILPGTELEVRRAGHGKGCVCVRVRQSSLVLGESLAEAVCCDEQSIDCAPGQCVPAAAETSQLQKATVM